MAGWGKGWGVARKLRVQYPGAIYHVMNRGKRLNWTESELRQRRKGDPKKVRIAGRSREKTTMTLKWIAGELYMGAWTHVSNLLSQGRLGKK